MLKWLESLSLLARISVGRTKGDIGDIILLKRVIGYHFVFAIIWKVIVKFNNYKNNANFFLKMLS